MSKFSEKRFTMLGPKIPYRKASGRSSNEKNYYSAAKIMPAKYNGTCDECSGPINIGDQIVYNTFSRATYHYPLSTCSRKVS